MKEKDITKDPIYRAVKEGMKKFKPYILEAKRSAYKRGMKDWYNWERIDKLPEEQLEKMAVLAASHVFPDDYLKDDEE